MSKEERSMRKNKRNENKSGFAVLAAWLVLALAWPSLGFGDEAQGHKLAFKAGAGAVFRPDQSFDTGFLYGAGFFTLVTPRLGLELLITGNRVHMDEPPAGLSAGKLATTQVLLSGQYRFSQGTRFIPYAIFGLEFNFFYFWPADEAEEKKADVVDRFAPHFGAGLDWALSDWLALNLDARYSIIKTWVEELPREGPINEVNPDEVDQINLNALTLTLGLKFFF
jgi:outer membrane protein W